MGRVGQILAMVGFLLMPAWETPLAQAKRPNKVSQRAAAQKSKRQQIQRKRAMMRRAIQLRRRGFRVVKARRNRVSAHTQAYKKRNIVGGHFNIKVTPPEKRGHDGYIGFEFYNFSKKYVSVADFYITLETEDYLEYEAHLTVEDLKPGWSDIRWAKIPSQGRVPEIVSLDVERFVLYDRSGKALRLPYTTDLIKR